MDKVTYCFDVDGTLTPSRSVMNEAFRKEFIKFAKDHDVCIVTGSDYAKTLEQVGQEVIDVCSFVFNCCGNEVRSKNHVRYQSTWKPGGLLLIALENEKRKSGFSVRTGNHIETRVGMVNFSIVGRNATREQRALYVDWDIATNERIAIAKKLMEMFPDIDCAIAGETGIDIYPKGKDKSQIREWVENKLVFFGDRCEVGGNDYPLAKVADVVYNVNSWQETQERLKSIICKKYHSNFDWPEEGFKEEDFTLDFIYDLHSLVGVNAPNEFANMLVFHDLDLYKIFCDRWMEYNKNEHWKTKEQKQPW